MNHMEEVAKMLGVELDEEFTTKLRDYKNVITVNGIVTDNLFINNLLLYELLTGKDTIVKKPFVPKVGEIYFFPSPMSSQGFDFKKFTNNSMDLQILKNLGAYRTGEEAQEEARKRGWID